MGIYDSIKNWFAGTAQTTVQPVANSVPTLATDSGSQQMLGTAREKKGHTMAGGRRATRRHRSSKKTSKRKH
jgi:hypothetical protein